MGIKNKSELRDQFKQGKCTFNPKSWCWAIQKSPLKFANSSELQKIKNRNRKNK